MTIADIHQNAAIFPDPEKFDPERWLQPKNSDTSLRNLRNYLVPFAKGTRSCVGMK